MIMKKEIETNRKNWDSRVPIHLKSKQIYNLEKFRNGENSFVANEDKELLEFIDVNGKSLLHLQCHFGLDTMSFARLGARSTGVDFSHKAIVTARELAEELGIGCEFVEHDVLELNLNREFDVVFTSVGVLTWLPDLKKWAHVVAKHLKNGGIFYIKDSHPITYTVDYDANSPDELRIKYGYFGDGKGLRFEEPWTYAHDGTDEVLEHKVHYEWQHPLSDIISSLISAGLKIVHLGESPYGFFQQFTFMTFEDGRWVFPQGQRDMLPLTFTIVATKE